MRDEDQREMASLRRLLYRAVRELGYVQELGSVEDMTASAEGEAIVNEGIKLLGVPDLRYEELPIRLERA
jgi:hypothetical protein